MFRRILVCLLIGQIVASPLIDLENDSIKEKISKRVSLTTQNQPCSSDPCFTPGTLTCVDLPNDFECNCKPNYAGKMCDIKCEPIDICWIIDESGSIGSSNFNRQRKFIRDVTASFDIGPNAMQIAAVRFDGDANVQFDFDDFNNNKNDILNAISNIPYNGGFTNPAEAFEKARDFVYNTAKGDRSNIQNIAIVLTDGNPNKRVSEAIPKANELKQHTNLGVKLYSVPVGSSVGESFIQGFASSPQTILRITDFNDIQSFRDELLEGLCRASSK